MLIVLAAFAAAIFMGLNIGGNNASASMGAAYGAKARTKNQAVLLIAVFSLLGAVFSGGEVIKTLGEGIIPGSSMTLIAAIVAIAAASISLFVGNWLKVPISASQAAVGAVVGIGVFLGVLNTQLLSYIVVWWVATPVLAFVLAYIAGKYLHPQVLVWLVDHESEAQIRKIIGMLLTVSGCYVAYSAGANNVANAVGPLVGAGFLSPLNGAILGGLTLGVGAILIGGRILETVGNDIAEICAIRAVFVEFIAAVIVHTASIAGIPVALGQVVPAAVIGIGCASKGMDTVRSKTVKRILTMWLVSPLIAGSLAYAGLRLVS
ncbi:PiT family inorganic phosphate transporter/sulfate permease [Methanohalophilus levihalophilus]|uniref:inorganic phosphate transporter n=1 Tax=Methanohalophilus levihalophilus TaxID=1431282 RepID=UPI001AE8EA94|nr:inorganic phosphate transporter [Methanohalophilus levihalophilus]MBP2031263.1 PiT family inorganic phosphate transporter/sulfate permease [Methanohalophilus levihalophilus]